MFSVSSRLCFVAKKSIFLTHMVIFELNLLEKSQQCTISWVTLCARKQFCKRDWGSQKPSEKCLNALLTPPFDFLRKKNFKSLYKKNYLQFFGPQQDSNPRTPKIIVLIDRSLSYRGHDIM